VVWREAGPGTRGSFLVCIEDSELCFSWSFLLVFVPSFSVRFHGFECVSPRISLRETWIDVSRIFVIDLVPSNAGKPLRFESFHSVLKLLVVLKGFAITVI
jgi:hypothetical protein